MAKSVLPQELQKVRDLARKTILPIQPIDTNTKAEKDFLFTAGRTEAGRSLPPYYLVYFLLVDLLGFKDLGQCEKLAWSIPIDFNGTAYLIEHRKFGVGVFARDVKSQEDEAKQIVTLIQKGVGIAQPYFKWVAENAVKASKFNVRNVSNKLFERYVLFKDGFFTASVNSIKLKCEHESDSIQYEFGHEFGFHRYSVSPKIKDDTRELLKLFRHPWVQISENASWYALAAIEAFFSWTEHVFVLLSIVQGRITTGAEVAAMVGAEWGEKFKIALDLNDRDTKKHYDDLIILRRQLRNFVAHGSFGKEGEAFSFHSGSGAVPVAFDSASSKQAFSLSPEFAFDDTKALEAIEKFISHLWSGQRRRAKLYVQDTELPLILPMASDGTYKRAMSSINEMEQFIDYLSRRFDDAANMDW